MLKNKIDAILTATFTASCCMGVNAGMLYGVQSGKTVCGNVKAKGHELVFVDCDYVKYNHKKHSEYIKTHNPKYCTVRDIMTIEQCQELGAEFYSLEQILDWANELSEYAQNVIIIPKYDCLDKIPGKFILGYSIPTKHGGTPLPIEMFYGKRVHLLGGSWKEQIKAIKVLGDSVVSFDNNHVTKLSKWGTFFMPDGTSKQLKDIELEKCSNVMTVCTSISCGNIVSGMNSIFYGGEKVIGRS